LVAVMGAKELAPIPAPCGDWRKSWERTGDHNLGLYHGSDGESYTSGTSYRRDNSRYACNDARVDTGEDLQAMAYVRL